MPGGRRTDRISQRDLEVLEFVARFGVVPREAVAMWAGTARAVTAARERRLGETGLIEVKPGFGDTGRIVICKRAGLRACCRGKRVRSVPMMPAVIDTLAQLKEREHFTDDDDLVFCSEVGKHLDHFRLRKSYYAALERAGLRRVRFHDLRHAFGTAAIKTLDPYAVQSYMGHQHYSTTQRYLHHRPRREDAAALAEAFFGSSREQKDAGGEHRLPAE